MSPIAPTLCDPALVLGHDFSCLNSGRRAVAQLARVAVSKAAGWGFESLLPCKLVLKVLKDSDEEKKEKEKVDERRDRNY